MNQNDETSTRPNVAAVGLAADDASAGTQSVAVTDPMGDVVPQYLSGTAVVGTSAPVAPAVGTADWSVVGETQAIFRRSVRDDRTCLYSGVPSGTYITVVNVDNNRSMNCFTSVRAPEDPQDELVMSSAAFATIADPTAAPIHVEIRQ